MIRITELSLPLDHAADELRKAIVKRLDIKDADLLNFTVFKRSYDARKKNSTISFVYIVDLAARDEAAILKRFARDQNVKPAPDTNYYPVAAAPSTRSRGTPGSRRYTRVTQWPSPSGRLSVNIGCVLPYRPSSIPLTMPVSTAHNTCGHRCAASPNGQCSDTSVSMLPRASACAANPWAVNASATDATAAFTERCPSEGSMRAAIDRPYS